LPVSAPNISVQDLDELLAYSITLECREEFAIGVNGGLQVLGHARE
jgi:hypothetical protein